MNSSDRGVTLIELLIVVAMLAIACALVFLSPVRSYLHARAAADAAQTMAQDVALLERVAQNGGANDGATLQIISTSPLVYECYYGRPNAIDPNSALGALIVRRSYDDVTLSGGPISATTPLLFASNGSAQYVAAGVWADQHQTIAMTLAPSGDESRSSAVDLDLFTGGISLP